MNIVLVGAGSHSSIHHGPSIQHYVRQHPGAIHALVCDLSPEKATRAQERFGFERAFHSLDELFAQVTVDAAISVLPFDRMTPVIRAFTERRIPLAIEKPLGADLEAARRIVRVVEESGSPVMVSLNRRFDPALLRAKEWIAGIGPVRYVHGAILRHGRTEPGFVWGTAVHLLDAMVAAAGPLTVSPQAAVVVKGPGGCGRAGRLEGRDGIVGTFEILPACGRVEEYLRLAGDGWCVDLWTGTPHPWKVQAWLGGKPVLDEAAPADQPEFIRNGAYNETAAFIDAALARVPPPAPSPLDALVATELADRLQRLTS